MHTTPPTSHLETTRWSRLHRVCLIVFVASQLVCTGCKSLSSIGKPDKKYDQLEAELRTREREILEMRSELQHFRQSDPYAYGRGPYPVPTMPAPTEGYPLSMRPPHTGVVQVKEVLLGNGTGGRDDDGVPGDELLQVVIVPKDEDGTAVKIPLRAVVTVCEINREGKKLPIGKWEVTPEQIRRTWKSGLIGSGYFVPLTWDRPPTTDRIRVVIRVQTSDGTEFEADRDCKVTPIPGLRSQPSPGVLPGPGPTFPSPSSELPPPTPVFPRTSPAPTIIPPPA